MCSILLALSTLMADGTADGQAATRDPRPDHRLDRSCGAGGCSRRCPCPFDRWQDARLLKYGYGMTADPEAAAFWYRRAADKGMRAPPSTTASC